MRLTLTPLALTLLAHRADAFTTPTFLSPGAAVVRRVGGVLGTDSPSPVDAAPSRASSTALFITREEIKRRLEEENDIWNLDEDKYVQKLSKDERRENLEVMRQIFKSDLADLQRRRDYSGWVEAKKDLKKRESDDPWFELNNKLREAVQIGEDEQAEKIRGLMEKVGGPPPGVRFKGEYAKITEIMDTPMSIARAETIAEQDQRKKNHERWKSLMAQREANEKAAEEERLLNPNKEEEEASIRRERMLKRLYGEYEEKRKAAEAKAREIMAQNKDDDYENTSALDRAMKQVRKDADDRAAARRQMRLEEGRDYEDVDVDDDDDDDEEADASSAASRRKSADAGGRPRLPGDLDVTRGELMCEISDTSDVTTDDLQVQVSSDYSASQSDPPMRKHCFQYTIKITNKSATDTVQLLSRRFEIQTVGARQKDVVQGQGVTGRQPILKPGETFEYTSTAPLSVRPIGTTIIAARMKGTYSYSVVDPNVKEEDRAVQEAELGTFHFVFPPDQRVKPVTYEDDDEDDEDEDDDEDDEPVRSTAPAPAPAAAAAPKPSSALNPPTTLPGDADMTSGDVPVSSAKDNSETVTDAVRVSVTSEYREERSDDKLNKHCFAYSIRITNEREESVQLVSRRFEIQTVGSKKKDVIQGPGVTGRQPVLKPGESFEYTSTAPLSVKPSSSTPVVARMSGEYSFVVLGEDGKSPLSSEALKARLGVFHFILPQMA